MLDLLITNSSPSRFKCHIGMGNSVISIKTFLMEGIDYLFKTLSLLFVQLGTGHHTVRFGDIHF